MPLIEYETRAGDPIRVGKVKVIPLAHTLRINIPGVSGGLIWNRPATVVVQNPDGEEQIFPVQDVTRQAQLALLGAGLAGSLFIWLMFRFIHKKRSNRDD